MAKAVKRNILICLAAVAAAGICLLVEGPSTCFLYPHFSGTDSSVFQYIGREWALYGRIPYRDSFDHKGPLLFFLNAVGVWLTKSRYGIWFVQVAFMALALTLVYKASRLKYKRAGAVGITTLYLLSFSYFSSEGNLSEEYSLLFLVLGIYFVLKFYASGKEEHNPVYAFVYGICFGAMLMIRVNNAILLLGFCFGIFLQLLLQKQWKNLIKNIICGFLGIGTVVLPFCIYFAVYGLEYDMWNATLLFNMKYSKNALNWIVTREEFFRIMEYSMIAMVALAVSVIHFRKNRDTLAPGCFTGVLCSEVMLWGGHRYKHYFMLYIVLIPVIFFLLAEERESEKAIAYRIKVGVCIFILLFAGHPVGKVGNDIIGACKSIERDGKIEGKIWHKNYRSLKKIAEMIPEEERDYVAGYNIEGHFWLETGLSSCYKYFVFHDSHSLVDPEVKEEMTELFLGGEAKWIVKQGEIYNESINHYIINHYEAVYDDGETVLYKKRCN